MEPGAIGALVQRPEARCRGSAGASRRSAGVIAVLPRVVGHAGQGTTANAGPAELGRRGFAQDDGTSGFQTRRNRRIGIGDATVLRMRTRLGGETLQMEQVLDRHRHAQQRYPVVAHQGLFGLSGHVERQLRRKARERVDTGLGVRCGARSPPRLLPAIVPSNGTAQPVRLPKQNRCRRPSSVDQPAISSNRRLAV